ncbi:MAG: hypothetical protein NTY74_04215 [Ignavibacteriae bacterium]|nr:hypothetical protein [Ignavibacteriota bacterium]
METEVEKILTNSHKAGMISYVSKNPECFSELMDLSITDKQPYSWRAAWLVWSCMEKNDKRIRKYVKDIIKVLQERKDGQLRELLKILEQMEIDEESEGLLFDHCVTVWLRIDKQPSVRFNAFKILVKITHRYPELAKEVLLLTRNQYMASLSPCVNKSINKMIKEIK